MIVIFITLENTLQKCGNRKRFSFFSTLPFHLDFSPSKINQSFLFMLLDTTTKQGSPFSKMSKLQQTSIDNVDMLPTKVMRVGRDTFSDPLIQNVLQNQPSFLIISVPGCLAQFCSLVRKCQYQTFKENFQFPQIIRIFQIFFNETRSLGAHHLLK